VLRWRCVLAGWGFCCASDVRAVNLDEYVLNARSLGILSIMTRASSDMGYSQAYPSSPHAQPRDGIAEYEECESSGLVDLLSEGKVNIAGLSSHPVVVLL